MNPEAMEPAGALEDGLKFDRAEFHEGAKRTLSCGFCNQDVYKNYFEINGRVACERCRYEVERRLTGSSHGIRFLMALGAGIGAAAIGAALWYTVASLSGYEFGLIALVVGVMVGYAVRWGSHGTGGWPYQVLAIFLTYMSIVSTYVPTMIAELRDMAEADRQMAVVQQNEIPGASEQQSTIVQEGEIPGNPGPQSSGEQPGETLGAKAEAPGTTAGNVESGTAEVTVGDRLLAYSALLLLATAVPFLGGFDNIIGILIIGFALYEAWKLNRRTPLDITGPYNLGAKPSSAVPAPGPEGA